MGYDANIKSDRSERKQRNTLMVSFLVLTITCFLAIRFIQSDAKRENTRRLVAKSLGELDNAPVADAINSPSQNIRNDAESKQIRLQKEKEAAERVAVLEAEVRLIKQSGVIMEADAHSLEVTGKLQQATKELLKLRYGDPGTKNYRIRFELEFQSTIPDFEENGKDGSLLIELAPMDIIPCSVFNFLEIARTWKSGAFHRNAGHVLQAKAHSDRKLAMPFQEYSDKYPHVKGTVGYAGRPSGPAFYISIRDNSKNHGPGSQQKHNPYEADSVIGKVIDGGMETVVPRIHKMPGKEFLRDNKGWVLIRRMHVLVPGDGPGSVDGYVEFSSSPLEIPK